MAKQVDYRCTKCGESVYFDAWASWDSEQGKMVLENHFDHSHCPNCDGECSYEKVTLNENVKEPFRCPDCGEEVEEGIYCSNCGNKLY